MPPSVQLSLAKVILNAVFVLLAWVPVLTFKAVVVPYQRGYYCDDESIRYPFKPSTVSTVVLFLVGGSVPIIVISCFEAFRLKLERKPGVVKSRLPVYTLGRQNRKIHRLLVRLYIFIGFFIFGAAVNQLITDISKYSIGRLRPHFISVCQPQKTTSCTHEYIYPIKCFSTKYDSHVIQEARLSFFSGHSAFSFYAAVYTILYIEARVVWTLYSPLVRPLIQVVFLCMAVFCALSRVSDYKHHWSDVLTGSIVGTIVGLVITIGVVRMFKRRELSLLLCDDVSRRSSRIELKALSSTQPGAVETKEQQETVSEQGHAMV